jgi:hypothetical protein
MTEGMLKMKGVFGELERNMISQRVKSGMQNAELTTLKHRLAKLNSDIDYLIETLISHKSNSLFAKLDKLENKKQELEAKIYHMQLLKPVESVSEQDIAKAFEQIRKKLLRKKLEKVQQIIEVYVDRIEIYPDRAVVPFNYMPKIALPRLKPPNIVKAKEESAAGSQINELSSDNHPKYMGHFGGESGIRSACLRQAITPPRLPLSATGGGKLAFESFSFPDNKKCAPKKAHIFYGGESGPSAFRN